MPLYEYKCKEGHVFDAIQSFSEDPLTQCEICGAQAKRVLSAPAIHFKGSGFYNTDYGTRRRAKEKESNSNSPSSSESSGDSSSSSEGGPSKSDSSSGSGSGSSSTSTSSTSSTSAD
jgi:putative FmdB family regulatory protein